MKIATWNVNSIRVRQEHILDWLRTSQADVLALQETKVTDAQFPNTVFEEAGYQVTFSGQPKYNGVAVLTKGQTMHDIECELPGVDSGDKRILAVTVGKVRILNVYVVNGKEVGCEHYAFKMTWLDALARLAQKELDRYPHCVILGDFNVAPQDQDVHDPVQWQGKILCSEPERNKITQLLKAGFVDTYREKNPQGSHFSWWDYRQGAFRNDHGLRIDLILASCGLANHCRASWIDPQPRGWERPSDHTPAVAEFDI